MIPRQNRVAIMTNLRTHFRRVDASFCRSVYFFAMKFHLRYVYMHDSIQFNRCIKSFHSFQL